MSFFMWYYYRYLVIYTIIGIKAIKCCKDTKRVSVRKKLPISSILFIIQAMSYTAVYTISDLTSVKSAIITLATRPAARVSIGGRMVDYTRSDLQFLRELLNDIQMDLEKQSSDGGLALIRPVGRE
jgi:hypothetical protein